MDTLVAKIEAAFSVRQYPGDENITRCTYDRKNGGSFDGPCWECVDIAEHFRGRAWRTLSATELFRKGQNDALFTVSAYCYFLPAYLIAAVCEPTAADVCVDHLTYRFGPEPDDVWGNNRVDQIRAELRETELAVTLEYFRFTLARDGDFNGFCTRSIGNLEAGL